jgi:hypothetical protein
MTPDRDTSAVTASGYWDSGSELPRVAREPRSVYSGLRGMGAPATYLKGDWADRNWRNVPGPFYGAETDTCGCGPTAAPLSVLCDETGQEFVWRQPRSMDELRAVLDAACQDPFGGYGCDGDAHWTPKTVLEWWERRERVIDWIASQGSAVVAPFSAYIDEALGDDLRRYADWLSRR